MPGTHPYYIPPGLAPQAVSGGIEDGVAGPRHSALGLEGVESLSMGHKNALGESTHGKESIFSHLIHGGKASSMKAPTVRSQTTKKSGWYH